MLPADLLLRVSATATDVGGATAHLVLTAHAPNAGDGSEPAAMAAANCDDAPWKTDVPAPRRWIRLDLDTTTSAGVWPAADSIGVWTGGGQGWQAWSGSWTPFEAYCDTGLAVVPGTAHGLEPVGATDSATDRASWLFDAWGFAWMADTEPGDRPGFTFTSCTIELGPAAEPFAATLTRTPPSGGGAIGDTCEFGPAFR